MRNFISTRLDVALAKAAMLHAEPVSLSATLRAGSPIQGTDGTDSLIGTNGDDLILGLGGRDTLNGVDGNDTLLAGAGDDFLYDNQGSNVFDGGDGNDWIVIGNGYQSIDGGAGTDTLSVSAATQGAVLNLLDGTVTTDTTSPVKNIENFQASNFNDRFIGNGQDNNFWLSLGSDTANGGDGWDTISAQFLGTAITGNLGTGVITYTNGSLSFVNFEALYGSDYNDVLTGSDGDDVIRGRGGNDTLNGGAGWDVLDYKDAAGAVTVNLAAGTATGADGNDVFTNFEDVRGSNFADILTGDSNDNFLRGMGGNDTLDGGAGSDWADYKNASGSVTVSLVTNRSSGADGVDTLINIENIRGGDYNDLLIGNGGDNRFRGMLGDDTIQGGQGIDRADYSNAPGAVIVILTDTVTALGKLGRSMGADGKDTLYSIENVRGSNFDDVLVGNSDNNTFRGMVGDDSIFGGAGSDTVEYQNAAAGVIVDLFLQQATGADGNDILDSIENATGGDYADILNGNTIGNILDGGRGDDMLSGSDGNDTILGGSGNDILNGGTGSDSMTGGSGSDTFSFAPGASGQTATMIDLITDFTKGAVGAGDVIDYTANLTIGGSAAAATATQASISQTNGIASFASGSGTSLADALADIATRFTAATDSAGEFAFFRVNATGNFYLFISDGTAGLTANDVVVQLTGITALSTIAINNGDLTILT